MRLLPLLAVAATAVRAFGYDGDDGDEPEYRLAEYWDGQSSYNASSPMVPFTGFDLAKPATNGHGVPANWTVGQRIMYNTTSKHFFEYTYFLEQGGHAKTGLEDWHLGYTHYDGPLRNATEPIKADCSNLLSAECIRMIKEFGVNGGDFDPEDNCPVVHMGGAGFGAPGLKGADKSVDSVAASFTDVLHGPYSYDEVMRTAKVFYASWEYKDAVMGGSLGCFGMETFESNARSLADILGVKATNDKPTQTKSADAKPTESKPADNKSGNKTDGKAGDKADGKSAASVVAASWLAGLLAISFAL